MTQLDFNLIPLSLAKAIDESMIGFPSEDRVVLAVNTEDKKTASGLFIPGEAGKDDLPRQGVVVRKGPDGDDSSSTHKVIQVGMVVHFGKYGGKEIFPAFKTPIEGVQNLKFYVLSSSEVIFIEPNLNK